MSGLEQFGGYQKALALFDLVVADMTALRDNPLCWRLTTQQVGSADSICSNIEEGHGRLSRAEYVRFLDYARASAKETQGRYRRMRHWLPAKTVEDRVRRLDEIIGILARTIATLRANPSSASRGGVREDEAEYAPPRSLRSPRPAPPDPPFTPDPPFPSTPDPRPSSPPRAPRASRGAKARKDRQ